MVLSVTRNCQSIETSVARNCGQFSLVINEMKQMTEFFFIKRRYCYQLAILKGEC